MTLLGITDTFAGAAILSPWVTFNTIDAKSMQKNRKRDTLAISALDRWSTLFQGGVTTDYYLEPLSAPPQWWADLPVRHILVTAGSEEVFVDDIEAMTGRLQAGKVKTTLVVTQGEVHDHLVMEFALKESQSQQRTAFQERVCARME